MVRSWALSAPLYLEAALPCEGTTRGWGQLLSSVNLNFARGFVFLFRRRRESKVGEPDGIFPVYHSLVHSAEFAVGRSGR
jgi:hypothetical protein